MFGKAAKDGKPVWAFLFALTALFAMTTAQAEWWQEDAAIMGTAIHVELWHDDPEIARTAIAAVLDEMRRIDALWSPYKAESELSRVNREAATAPVKVGAELIDIIGRARLMSERTQGAFDITFASVGHLYDYRQHQHPDTETVKALLPAIDYRHVVTDGKAGTVSFSRPGVRIDLGGIAKGYAVDRCIAILADLGVRHAMVGAGGDSRILGRREAEGSGERPWMVGVRDPRRDGELIAVLPLADTAVSTSGDYERYFEENGRRYHHIIDPDTGASAGQVRSVTILGPEATTTDALSTSVFVLGVEQGMKLIDSMAGFEAIIVDSSGKLLYSKGLQRP